MTTTHPAGFTAAGVEAGLKTSGGKDLRPRRQRRTHLRLRHRLHRQPLQGQPDPVDQEVVKDGTVRAVVLNSGGANCYTGPDGFQTTHAVAERVAERLGIGAIDVVVCSTGLIGLANDRDALLAGVDDAHAHLSADGGPAAAG